MILDKVVVTICSFIYLLDTRFLHISSKYYWHLLGGVAMNKQRKNKQYEFHRFIHVSLQGSVETKLCSLRFKKGIYFPWRTLFSWAFQLEINQIS